jgi:CubicO group peptidase (beta-lactamase class C family)
MLRIIVVLALLNTASARGSGEQMAARSGWRQYSSVAEAGFDPGKLARARTLAEQAGSDAVLVVHEGHVVAAWGDPTRRFKTYSIRKSLLSLMYGAPSVVKSVRLDRTLADLEIDDVQGLTAAERAATVAQLLAARSGVYHPAAREPQSMMESRPARGSAAAGAQWFYNNWDFNTLGTIFRIFTGTTVADGFRTLLAEPLGMEDFRTRDAYAIRELSKSRQAAFEFHLSARDLARVGQLVLQHGSWNGREIVSRAWLDDSLRIRSPFPGGGGYAHLWWIDAGRFRTEGKVLPALESVHDVAATGAGEQLLLIVPQWNLVVVHLNQDDTLASDAFEVAELVLQARTGRAGANAALGDITAVPLPNVPAPLPERTAAGVIARPQDYVGTYEVSPTVRATIRFIDDGLFIDMPGRGEAELFREAADRFFLKVADVVVMFERDASGQVTGARVTERGRALTARKLAAP